MKNEQTSPVVIPTETEIKRRELISVLANIIRNYATLKVSK